MSVPGPRVLISGASVAGPVLAYWLQRWGFVPTVIERTSELRASDGGHAVDLFGPALDVMDWMGVLPKIEAARTHTRLISFVRAGRRAITVPAEALSEGVSERHIEIMRGDVARIVNECTREHVQYVFDDSIATLQDTGAEVEVTFERGASQTYDLVIGADGLHSHTRSLVFGAEQDFLNYLGGYLAVFTVPNYLRLVDTMVAFSAPSRTAGLYPVGDGSHARVVLLWRAPHPHDFDRHDLGAQRAVIRAMYGDLGWKIPRLLAELEHADDLYLDSISQVLMDTWTRGRVALVGDAGYSPAPAVGGGTSLAVIGAYLLATELKAAGGDHVRGFTAYEEALRPVVDHSRSIGPTILRTIIPTSQAQVWVTAQAIRMIPHVPAPQRRRLTSFGGSAAAMLDQARLRPPNAL